MSQILYKIDPQYAVTFNEIDYIRYQQKYSGIEVYFWIDWQAVRFNGSNSSVKVLPMQGVWLITYNNMLEAVKMAPLHTYSQRVNDKQGNAKKSFILDLSSTYFSKIV
ncbi:hypothetical protein H8S90_13805 [Olivibacter sp. SDN3]|uniref:hypothetical protein n=1 Tax=Olivibacter sp. SDN3 TaxID=2764720 RepID=UPI0016519EC0|nr:hypothetical protein [Olivibacter sp. SDN3]QNL47893.1 hypothetical protein H8S90_13805 [Olivibacter sp. SDN3]